MTRGRFRVSYNGPYDRTYYPSESRRHVPASSPQKHIAPPPRPTARHSCDLSDPNSGTNNSFIVTSVVIMALALYQLIITINCRKEKNNGYRS